MADLVLNVIDASDPNFHDQRRAVKDVLASLGVSDDKILEVYNKADATTFDSALDTGRIYISALKDTGIIELKDTIEQRLRPALILAEIVIPYTRGDVLNYIQKACENPEIEYMEEGTRIKAYIKPEYYNKALAMLAND